MPISPIQALWFLSTRLPNKLDIVAQSIVVKPFYFINLGVSLYSTFIYKIKHNMAFVAKLPTLIMATIDMADDVDFANGIDKGLFHMSDSDKFIKTTRLPTEKEDLKKKLKQARLQVFVKEAARKRKELTKKVLVNGSPKN